MQKRRLETWRVYSLLVLETENGHWERSLEIGNTGPYDLDWTMLKLKVNDHFTGNKPSCDWEYAIC